MDHGPKLGDAASLWNFTPSPGASPETCCGEGGKRRGWARAEPRARRRPPTRRLDEGGGRGAEACARQVRRRALGADRGLWRPSGQAHPAAQRADAATAWAAVACRCATRSARRIARRTLRTLAQLTSACETPAFTGLHIDVDAVRKDNEAKQGDDVIRKSGLIINSGGARRWPPAAHAVLTRSLQAPPTERRWSSCGTKTRISAHALLACLHCTLHSRRAWGRYGLSKEYVDSIVLPSPVKTAQTATLERQAQAGGHRAKGKPAKATVKLSLMSAPLDGLSDGQCRALLCLLHQRLHSLLGAAPDAAAAPVRRVLLASTNCLSLTQRRCLPG